MFNNAFTNKVTRPLQVFFCFLTSVWAALAAFASFTILNVMRIIPSSPFAASPSLELPTVGPPPSFLPISPATFTPSKRSSTHGPPRASSSLPRHSLAKNRLTKAREAAKKKRKALGVAAVALAAAQAKYGSPRQSPATELTSNDEVIDITVTVGKEPRKILTPSAFSGALMSATQFSNESPSPPSTTSSCGDSSVVTLSPPHTPPTLDSPGNSEVGVVSLSFEANDEMTEAYSRVQDRVEKVEPASASLGLRQPLGDRTNRNLTDSPGYDDPQVKDIPKDGFFCYFASASSIDDVYDNDKRSLDRLDLLLSTGYSSANSSPEVPLPRADSIHAFGHTTSSMSTSSSLNSCLSHSSSTDSLDFDSTPPTPEPITPPVLSTIRPLRIVKRSSFGSAASPILAALSPSITLSSTSYNKSFDDDVIHLVDRTPEESEKIRNSTGPHEVGVVDYFLEHSAPTGLPPTHTKSRRSSSSTTTPNNASPPVPTSVPPHEEAYTTRLSGTPRANLLPRHMLLRLQLTMLENKVRGLPAGHQQSAFQQKVNALRQKLLALDP